MDAEKAYLRGRSIPLTLLSRFNGNINFCVSPPPSKKKGGVVQARGRGACLLPGGQDGPAAAVHHELCAGHVLPHLLGCVLETDAETRHPPGGMLARVSSNSHEEGEGVAFAFVRQSSSRMYTCRFVFFVHGPLVSLFWACGLAYYGPAQYLTCVHCTPSRIA